MTMGLYRGHDIESELEAMLTALVPTLRSGGFVKDQAVAVVVMDPKDESTEWFDLKFGEPAVKYLVNASKKAKMVARTGRDSSEFSGADRALLDQGDFPWAGGVKRHGIIVGVSGWSQGQDQFLAELVASYIFLKMGDAIDDWKDSPSK